MHQAGWTAVARCKYCITAICTVIAGNTDAGAGSTAVDADQVFNHVVASIAFICRWLCSF
jgi:hypothetical protein